MPIQSCFCVRRPHNFDIFNPRPRHRNLLNEPPGETQVFRLSNSLVTHTVPQNYLRTNVKYVSFRLSELHLSLRKMHSTLKFPLTCPQKRNFNLHFF